MNSMTEEKRKVIVDELTANEKNYQGTIDGLADASMWLMDGSVSIDDDMRDKMLRTLAMARGQLKIIVELLNQENL